MIPIPVGDENPTARRPVVNVALIAANGLVFLWFNLVRGEGLGLTRADAMSWGLLPGDPEPLRFLTSLFLHQGPWHLLGNMWFLHIFGDNVEDKLGRGTYLLLYLGWGVLASLAFLVLGQPVGAAAGIPAEQVEEMWRSVPLVGASGAISGVMGAYLVFFPRARIRMVVWLLLFILPFTLPALLVIGYFLLQDLLLGVVARENPVGGIAYAAHTGGMIAGIIAALLLKPFLRARAASAWDRDTGFAPGGGRGGAPERPSPLERPRAVPSGDLRDQVAGAALDGRMDLALDLYARWVAEPRLEALPPAVEIEIAHEILRRGRVVEALEAYRRFLGSHPRSPEAPEAKFRIGLIFARAEGDPERARPWLQEASLEHPDPETASFARRELETLDRG